MDIKSLPLDDLIVFVKEIGEPKFRALQIFEWLHNKNVSSFDSMTNLPKDLRRKLSESAHISNMFIVNKYYSDVDDSTKYLFEIEKDNIILESVYMSYNYGNSVCVSSQAGCRMGCKICASTVNGLERNLTAGEMLTQVYDIGSDINARVSHVVIMGSGEPLDNYDSVLNFIKIINSGAGLGISQRHITLSTCGIIDNIYKLAGQKLQITLAVSLHAPNDDIRKCIMPVAKSNSFDDLLTACKFYADETSRRITFEYVLINDLNDSVKCAIELADRISGINCHVNLIPLNEIKTRGSSDFSFKPSPMGAVQKFKEILEKRNVNVTVRRSLGQNVAAACGQLKLNFK